ncbi:hypothetical protein F2P56_005267 [Juglans regia]|uniref:Uncharacterized protein n=2 Tax=Juglans regia TaxID=51240 RepID=A0A833Y9D2_JUGRE|nr:uncharacterized protein LOC109013823 isoform X2 [Juglans regia]KAF5478729.1 hypothetical protein F2P56_005267 [Juglans regia]
MAVWTGAAYLVRHSSSKTASSAQAAFLLHRRGLARGGDHQGPPKVNFWQDPLHPSRWKEEHFVIVSLAGWGLLFYGGYKFFTKGKKNKKRRSESWRKITLAFFWGCFRGSSMRKQSLKLWPCKNKEKYFSHV